MSPRETTLGELILFLAVCCEGRAIKFNSPIPSPGAMLFHFFYVANAGDASKSDAPSTAVKLITFELILLHLDVRL